MSESKIIDVPMVEQRSIGIVTAEILTYKNQYKQQTIYFLIEVGKRLVEAKSMLEHGEWEDWLEREVDFKTTTANNLMKIYREYGTGQQRIDGAGNLQAIENLSYTQIVRLLSVPVEERDEFIRENDIENKSSREIEQLVRERDDAKRKLDDTEKQLRTVQKLADDAGESIEKLRKDYHLQHEKLDAANAKAQAAEDAKKAAEDKLTKAKEAKKKAKDKLKEMQDNPTVPPEVLEKVKAEAEAAAKAAADQELEAKTAELRAAAEQAQKDAQEAKKNVEAAQAALLKAKKELLLAEPEVTEFNLRLQTVAKDYQELISALDAIKEKNAEKGQKLTAAVRAMLEKFSQQIGG